MKWAHIRDGAAQLARALAVDPSELQIGEVSGDAAAPAKLVTPEVRATATQAFSACCHRSRVIVTQQPVAAGLLLALFPTLLLPLFALTTLAVTILALIGSAFGAFIGNARFFLRPCLPSSNGFFTARAVGAMYGAIANGGALADGRRILSAAMVTELRQRASDASQDVAGFPRPGRQTCGWSPWLGAQVEARVQNSRQTEDAAPTRLAILGHDGMGGSCAYADLDNNIAIAVLKTAFSPNLLDILEGGGLFAPGRVCTLVDDAVRQHLSFPGMAADALVARSPTRRLEKLAEAATAKVSAAAASLDAAVPRKSAGELYREAAGGDDDQAGAAVNGVLARSPPRKAEILAEAAVATAAAAIVALDAALPGGKSAGQLYREASGEAEVDEAGVAINGVLARSPTRKVEQLAEAAAATVTATAAALDAALPRKSAGELYREAAGGDDDQTGAAVDGVLARSPTRRLEQLAKAAAATASGAAAVLDAAVPRKSAAALYREA